MILSAKMAIKTMVWTFFSTRNLRIQLRIACRLTCKRGEEEKIINYNDLKRVQLRIAFTFANCAEK
jgi:hypothetical protein